MIPLSKALETISARTPRLGSGRLPLDQALGRFLRADVRAETDVPPFDASAMDGYALRRADTTGPLRVIGSAQAGQVWAGGVEPGTCVRIFTGAPIPAGADCVVKQEDVEREADTIRVLRSDDASFIRRQGENRKRGDVVVPSGTKLGPTELAALASAGVDTPLVSQAPRCVHVATGNELVAPGQPLTGAQIRDSNSTLIATLLRQHGAVLAGQIRVGDATVAARVAVEALPAHDVLLVSGGAGGGDHDIARGLLEALGYTVHFGGINLRPGKPLMFATRDDQLAFALPGNPVSHWVIFQLFVAPALRQLESGVPGPTERLAGRIAADCVLPPPDPRPTYWPCRATIVGGGYELRLLSLASSGDSTGLAGANALLPLPLAEGNIEPSRLIEFIPCP